MVDNAFVQKILVLTLDPFVSLDKLLH